MESHPRRGTTLVLLSPSDGAENSFSHRRNGSEARSSDFSGLRMRDGEFLMMAYLKLDKMFCFRYRCVVSSLISAGSVCQPWMQSACSLSGDNSRSTHRWAERRDAAAAVSTGSSPHRHAVIDKRWRDHDALAVSSLCDKSGCLSHRLAWWE